MGLQDVVEETVGEVMAKCDALKRENEKLRTESGFLEAGARKLEARIAKLEKVKEAAMKVLLSWGLSIHGALQELEDALNATE